MVKKRITIDDLAGMVKAGFDDMGQRFHDVGKRFDAMDERFNRMDERFDAMDERFDRIENLILKRHEEEIINLKTRMQYIEDMLAAPLKK